MDVLHFVLEECRHLANNCCTAKCGSTSLCLIILCDVNTIGFVPVSALRACRVRDALVACCAIVHKVTPLSVNKNERPT